MAKKKPTVSDGTIALNKKAKHEYFLEESFEAGVVLEGWEVKSLRMKKVQLVDSYVLLKDGEAFLLGCQVTPLEHRQHPCHRRPHAQPRSCSCTAKELAKLFATVHQKGHTCVATKMYWKGHLVKCR